MLEMAANSSRRKKKSFWLVATSLCLVMALVLGLTGFVATRALRNMLYPRAPLMPAAVPETADKLLARYEQILRKQAPQLLAATQPGLSDAQIDALEKEHHFTLPPDLRALYRWRNGTSSGLDVFADHRFVPLDEALTERAAVGEGAAPAGFVARMFVSHREGWIEVITDPAGDGYYFDPARSESEGSFFFCFAEDAQFVFFPAFRNFLAASVEGHETQVLSFGELGAETLDFDRAQKLWERFGASNR
jgi:cell wall assembly regulator SMI1